VIHQSSESETRGHRLQPEPFNLKINLFFKNLYPAMPVSALMGNKKQKNTMQEVSRDLLVSLAAFATIFGIFYVFMITRYRERMAMLEKGVTPASFANKNGGSNTLKFGMLSVGISLGILAGNFLYREDIIERAPAFFSMIFLMGGLSLILNFVIDRKLQH
jgi:hypothetical protein